MTGGNHLPLQTLPTLYLAPALHSIPIVAAFLLGEEFHLEWLVSVQESFGFRLSSRKCVYTFSPLVMPVVSSTTQRLGYSGGSYFVKTRIPHRDAPSYLPCFGNCTLQPVVAGDMFTANKIIPTRAMILSHSLKDLEVSWSFPNIALDFSLSRFPLPDNSD
ncbi:hypothetical protein B0H10DRAFT_1987618 [Mycena sp. CBHHK59/15]|nr:hypothetical protein B0H10DRAFT_1987618 [Mycena sp. CBHHK59/15]